MGTRGSIGISSAVNEHADAKVLAIRTKAKYEDIKIIPNIIPYNTVVLNDNPILFTILNDVGPTNIVDSSVNGFNGIVISNPGFEATGLLPSDFDKSMNFPGQPSTAQCLMQDKNIYSFTDGIVDKPYSFEAVFNITDLSVTRPIFTKTLLVASISNEYVFVVNSSGQLVVAMYTGTTAVNHGFLSAASAISINNTYHVVGTYTGVKNSGLLYIQGIDASNANFENGLYTHMQNTASEFRIGVGFAGEVDPIRTLMKGREAKLSVYDYVLTPEQVTTHFDATGL